MLIVVQSLSCAQLFVIPWNTAHQTPLSSTISQSLLRFMSIKLMMLSNHLILYCLLLFFSSIFLSIKVFSSELALVIRWPKYWNLSFSISPSNEYSGLISFRINWFDLLVVQGTLQAPQLKSINSLTLNLLYGPSLTSITTGKTVALTMWAFVGKVMSLLFNTLSRFVIAFLSRSTRLLISWLQSLPTVIL